MRSSFGQRLSLWLPVVGALGLIYFLSSRSTDQLLYAGPDYIAHAVEYFALGLVLARALNGGIRKSVTPRVLLWTMGLCVLWALSDEFHQRFVPTRISSLRDVLSDTVGASLACAVFPLLVRMARRQRSCEGDAPAQLTFLTREDCHLCHEARQLLERVLPEHHVHLEVLDVDSSQDLARRYGHEVPVLLVNGSKASKLRMDEGRLRRRLRPWSHRAS